MERREDSLLEQETLYALNHPQEQPLVQVKGFGAAMFSIACGHVPVRCISEDGKNRFIYLFRPEVQETKSRYFACRDVLEAMQQQARKAYSAVQK